MLKEMRVGRYCIKKYDAHLVARMKSMARHVYAIAEENGKKVVYDLDHNAVPEKIMITDMMIHLTSAHDRMAFDTIMRDMLFIKDSSIAM